MTIWLWRGIALSVVGYLLIGLTLAIMPKGPVELLAGPAEWQMSSAFVPGGAVRREIPAEALTLPDFRLWRSNQSVVGPRQEIRVGPFPAQPYIGIPHFGFPGERVFLRCEGTGAEIEVAQTFTNAEWATTYLPIPPSFCGDMISLVATAAERKFNVGIGTPFAVTAARYYSEVAFPVRALVVVGTWIVLVGVMGAIGCAACWLYPKTNALAAGFVGVGAVGMLVFIAFHFSIRAGYALSLCFVFGGIGMTGLRLATDRELQREWVNEYGSSVLCWLLVSLTFTALASAIDYGAGSWGINGAFQPVRWSSDNHLPWQFAEAMYDGTPRADIRWGDWLAADRTPLLAAILLIVRSVLIRPFVYTMGSTFLPIAYMMAGIVVLASWVAALHQFAKQRLKSGATAIVVALAVTSPFFLFNTIYTWPKMLGAAYALLAALLLLEMRERSGAAAGMSLVLVAICASLSYLSHASNLFAMIGIAIIFAPSLQRQSPARIVLACIAAAIVVAPWLWWATYVQPGGNALLRSALTGDFGFDRRSTPIGPEAIAALQKLGIHGWLERSREHLMVMLGMIRLPWLFEGLGPSTAYGILGRARVEDFAILVRSIGVAALWLPAVAISALFPALGKEMSDARMLLGCGLAGALLTVATLCPMQIMPNVAYGVAALLFAAAAFGVAKTNPAFAVCVLVISLFYCGVVWIVHPLMIALRIEWTSLLMFSIGCVALTISLLSSFASSSSLNK